MATRNTMGIAKRGGRIDFSFDDVKDKGAGAVFLTEDPKGPLAMFIILGPNIEAPAHSHDADYVTVIVEGSLRVGRKWFKPGDIRVMDEGAVYGPSLTGPDGLKAIVFFSDRNGLPDRFAREEDRIAAAEMMKVLEAFARGEVDLPSFSGVAT